MVDKDNFEEKLLEQLTEMFRNMGMNLDKEQIRALMEQFRSQFDKLGLDCLLYTSPSPRDLSTSRMPSSA